MSVVVWRCPRPGCDYSATGGSGTHFEKVAAYHEAFHAARGADPIIIWDDPPTDPDWVDRHFDPTLKDWYDRYYTTETHDNADGSRTSFAIRNEDPAVRWATWLYPAVAAALAAGVVWLSYRAARR